MLVEGFERAVLPRGSGSLASEHVHVGKSAAAAAQSKAGATGRRRPSYDQHTLQAISTNVQDVSAVADATAVMIGPVLKVPPAKALKRVPVFRDAKAVRNPSPADRLRPPPSVLPMVPTAAAPANAIVATSAAAMIAAAHAVQEAVAASTAAGSGAAAATVAVVVPAAVDPQQRFQQGARRVRFAPGPLEYTKDGHPEHEGEVAHAVRHLPPSYVMDLTKGNVLMLEQMLGEECSDCSLSLTRLKRRVGLLPAIRPPRPYVTACPLSRTSPLCSPKGQRALPTTVRLTGMREAAAHAAAVRAAQLRQLVSSPIGSSDSDCSATPSATPSAAPAASGDTASSPPAQESAGRQAPSAGGLASGAQAAVAPLRMTLRSSVAKALGTGALAHTAVGVRQ